MPFWLDMGATWTYETRYGPEGYVEPEKALLEMLAPLKFHSVLDVGCGWGRLGQFMAREFPEAEYWGVDVSPDQISEALQRALNAAGYSVSPILEFTPDRKYDLVLCSEVLMHQPPDQIEACVEKLFEWSSRWVVTIDWYQPGEDEYVSNHWNFDHDYPALFGNRLVKRAPVERQMVFLSHTV